MPGRVRNCNDSFGVDLDNAVYALDATTIDLCLSLFPWAPFRSTKAAVKLHTLLDLRGNIPAFIHISDGKTHEVNVLDMLTFEAGAFYVMDRGYLDFGRLYALHQAGSFFVIRAKRGMNARRVYSMPTDRTNGVICDQRIALNGFYVARDYPEHLRRIRFKDADSGKTLVFLTNNTALPALTIATLYRNRWQVEMFFKWIKQHLRINRFIGNSENAVKTQIWCAVDIIIGIRIGMSRLRDDCSDELGHFSSRTALRCDSPFAVEEMPGVGDYHRGAFRGIFQIIYEPQETGNDATLFSARNRAIQ